MGRNSDNKAREQHTEEDKSVVGTQSVNPSSWKWWWEGPLGFGETMLPYLNPVAQTFSMNSLLLFPLVLHSLHFSVPYFVHLTLTFIHTSPALSFPSTYCLCPPLHSLDVIVRIFHNSSPSPDYSNEKCIQKFPHFALPFKPFPTFHWRLRSALWSCHSLLPFQMKPGGAQSHHSKTQL